MANDAPFHKVRWHVPAKSLGVTLPPGYHLLEAPLQLFLCYGDQEIARFAPGADPKDIQREAEAHLAKQQTPPTSAAAEDGITGLPWSVSVRSEAARLAGVSDLHVIAVHLGGLDTLMDVYGYKAAHSVLRQISRRMKRLMEGGDHLTRHSGDILLILTVRPLGDIKALVDLIHQQVSAVGLETDGDRLPHSRIGVATVDRLTDSDPATTQAMIDAVIISAEVASMGKETPSTPAQPEPATRSGANAPFDFASEFAPQAPAPGVGIPAIPPMPSAVEPDLPPSDDDLGAQSRETSEPPAADFPVYELPAAEPEPPQAIQSPAEQEEAPPVPMTPHRVPSPSQQAAEAMNLPAAAAMPVPGPDGAGRIRFKGASLDVSGMVATATVKLVHGEREVTGRAVGRNAQERRLFLAAEAAARAVTEFLPQGYGVVVHDIQPAPAEVGKALWAVVLFLTPNGEESLLGIAPIDDMVFEAAGKAVLNAVNRRVGLLLDAASQG